MFFIYFFESFIMFLITYFHNRYLKNPDKKPNHPKNCSICNEQELYNQIILCYEFKKITKKILKQKNISIEDKQTHLEHYNDCSKCEKFFDKKTKKESTK